MLTKSGWKGCQKQWRGPSVSHLPFLLGNYNIALPGGNNYQLCTFLEIICIIFLQSHKKYIIHAILHLIFKGYLSISAK